MYCHATSLKFLCNAISYEILAARLRKPHQFEYDFYLGEEFLQLAMISNCVQNQAPRANSCRVEFQFAKSATIIRFQILCSIGSPKIQIFRSNSEFPNQTYWARQQLLFIYEVWTHQIMCFAGNCLSGFHQTK